MRDSHRKAIALLEKAMPFLKQAYDVVYQDRDFDTPPAVVPAGAHTQNALWYAEQAIAAIKGEKS